MNRNHVRYLAPLLALGVVVTTAYAGGWAVITVNELPDHAVAGKPIHLSFVVRQHGRTLLTDLKPSIRATSATGLVADAPVVSAKGSYTAAMTLPQAGEWTITIDSGFLSSKTTLPALRVVSAESPIPAPISDFIRGKRLFVVKGCTSCHQAFASLALTGKQLSPDYLAKFLADPSIKTADMPNLGLKDSEIAALVAFLGSDSPKSPSALSGNHVGP